MRLAEPTIAPLKQPSAFHVAYYCNPSVPLIKHCGNVQKGALLPCCRAFCSTWPPIVGGAGRALTGDSIRFPIPSHRTRLYQDGGGPSVQHNPPRDYEESVKNRGQSRQILLRFSLLWRADSSVHRPIFFGAGRAHPFLEKTVLPRSSEISSPTRHRTASIKTLISRSSMS